MSIGRWTKRVLTLETFVITSTNIKKNKRKCINKQNICISSPSISPIIINILTTLLIIDVTINISLATESSSSNGDNNLQQHSSSPVVDDANNQLDRKVFESIKALHTRLDSDADGEVDDLESKQFLESDKKIKGNTAHKLSYLHQDGKDRSISVNELWAAWKSSQVHNWTVDETIYWLVNYVELPEYSKVFEQNSVNGTILPRLATDPIFISKLGIFDPAAKSKISIKAMDVVLFGPPKSSSSKWPIIVAIIIIIATSLCYFFYSRSQAATKDKLLSLQKAEDQMLELQQDLNKALKAQQLQSTHEALTIKNDVELKNLLQTTYNIESQYYNEKKLTLEMKANEVKFRNQKLQKKKATLLGLYKVAQDVSLEEDINCIAEIKNAILQVTEQVRERSERWRKIGELCGCTLDLG